MNSNAENQLLLSSAVRDMLPSMVAAELSRMTANDQAAFSEELDQRSKSIGAAYFCSVLYLHYAYLGRWRMTVLMWITALLAMGILSAIWWGVNLFRIPSLVRNYNKERSVKIMRDLKSIGS